MTLPELEAELRRLAPDGRCRYTRPCDQWVADLRSPLCDDAALIGSTRDGWSAHTGSERPADVGAEDRVEVFLANGSRQPALDGARWLWGVEAANTSRILAYRVVTRAQPENDPDTIIGTADDCAKIIAADPATVAREVAAESLRPGDRFTAEFTVVSRHPHNGALKVGLAQNATCTAGTAVEISERMLSVAKITLIASAPELLKVGDRAMWRTTTMGTHVDILAIDDGEAWVRDVDAGVRHVMPLNRLERIW